MDSDKFEVGVKLPSVGDVGVKPGAVVVSPEPPPGIGFGELELQVYRYICGVLTKEGIGHLTAGLPIAIIVRTYADWLKACADCEEKGRTQKAKRGSWHSETPWAADERRLKMELGQWLPKACLTIPSLARVRKDTGEAAGQDDLFSELVRHAQSYPKNPSMH